MVQDLKYFRFGTNCSSWCQPSIFLFGTPFLPGTVTMVFSLEKYIIDNIIIETKLYTKHLYLLGYCRHFVQQPTITINYYKKTSKRKNGVKNPHWQTNSVSCGAITVNCPAFGTNSYMFVILLSFIGSYLYFIIIFHIVVTCLLNVLDNKPLP